MIEHFVITRLKKLRAVFNAHFSRTATVQHALPRMSESVARIVQEAQTIQAGLHHLEEAHLDSQALSDEFAHLVTFAINLPTTLEGDKEFWGYSLNLVDPKVFQEGAEYCTIDQLKVFRKALNKVIAIKLSIRNEE